MSQARALFFPAHASWKQPARMTIPPAAKKARVRRDGAEHKIRGLIAFSESKRSSASPRWTSFRPNDDDALAGVRLAEALAEDLDAGMFSPRQDSSRCDRAGRESLELNPSSSARGA